MSAQLDTDAVTRAMLAAAPIPRPGRRKGHGRKAARYLAHWTAKENAVLLREWGVLSPRSLRGKLPGRSWAAIYDHAYRVLDLPLGLPQGTYSLNETARRLGFGDIKPVKLLAKRHGVVLRKHPHPRTIGPKRCGRRFVAWDEIEAALAREIVGTETVNGAARARGLYSATLWRWLLAAGALPARDKRRGKRRYIRLSTKVIDRVVAAHAKPAPRAA